MADLVFDIGMHNGDDTAYYLACGFDVVAVEANVALYDAAAERFRDELKSGRLTLRNIGISESEGELEFWISDHTTWSSFNKDNATKQGVSASSCRVMTIPFSRLLEEHRTPLYVKVDIECNDSLCVRDLARSEKRPKYFSFEGHPDAIADIDLLINAGYTVFKCIRQNDWAELTPDNMQRQERMRILITRLRKFPRLRGYLSRRHYQRLVHKEWVFASGSSGPLAVDLPGRWLSGKEIVKVWEHIVEINNQTGGRGFGEWFDIHAAISA